MRQILLVFLSVITLVSTGCDANLLSASAKTDTEEAITFSARRLMDQQLWTEAIAKINTLSAASLAKDEIKVLLASAYAGRCGLNLIQLAAEIEDISSSSLFRILLNFQKDDPDPTDCEAAEDLLQEIGEPTDRSEDENLLMALTALSKIGAYLANEADSDDDGNANASYSGCTLTDPQAAALVVGISLAATSLAEVSSAGGSVRTQLATVCTGSFCDNEEISDVDATEIDMMKEAVHQSGSIGLNTSPGTTCP